MAKVKVLSSFYDVHTGKFHPVGEVFEATKERVAEIQKVDMGLIEVKPAAKQKGVDLIDG